MSRNNFQLSTLHYPLPHGYKQTEVGVIPEDWSVMTLPEISWFQEGPGLRNWQFTTSGMKVINVTNLEDGVLNLDRTDRHISLAEFNQTYRHFAINDGDIVMASSGNSYSKVAVVRKQDLPLVMNTSVIRFKPTPTCDYFFLWAFLTSPRFKTQIDLMITGGAQPNFGPYHLRRVLVPVPPLPEQRAIASALSDVDALLGALDRLIAKKRDLKQAAMQQLLTGQTRLPGLKGEWVVKTLGEIAHIKTGNRNNEDKVEDGQYPFFVRSETVERINSYSHDCEAILVPGEGRIGSIFHYIHGRFDVHQRVYAITQFNPDISARFVHLYLSKNFGVWAMQNTVKATVDSLRLPTFQTFEMTMPPTLTEQTAIAEVLSDMDAEIAALEHRREKTRALKQGMMQELLTGRTRLVNGEGRVENGKLKRGN